MKLKHDPWSNVLKGITIEPEKCLKALDEI